MVHTIMYIGGEKMEEVKYNCTLDTLQDLTGANRVQLTLALYLLADSGYNNKDLYSLAKMQEERFRRKIKWH